MYELYGFLSRGIKRGENVYYMTDYRILENLNRFQEMSISFCKFGFRAIQISNISARRTDFFFIDKWERPNLLITANSIEEHTSLGFHIDPPPPPRFLDKMFVFKFLKRSLSLQHPRIPVITKSA